jgi:N-acetylmuramoyl-L-alanine amidase
MRKLAFKTLLVCLVLTLIAGTFGHAAEDAGRDAFYRAEDALRDLTDSADRQKFRHNWLRVAAQFEAIYEKDPHGLWASAAMYRAATTWLELYQRSKRPGDRETGIARLQELARQYPGSAYRQKAEARLAELGAEVPRAQAAPTRKASPGAAAKLERAERCRVQLQQNPRRTKHRDVWLNCIDQYLGAYEADPDGAAADVSLYQAGRLYLELAQYSRSAADRDSGGQHLEALLQKFPASRYRPMAATLMREAGLASAPVAQTPPAPAPETVDAAVDDTADEEEDDVAASTGLRTVSGLRYWSNPSYTRVVVDAEGRLPYFHHLLKKDPDLKKPQRLYIDLNNARLGRDFPSVVPINDDLLLSARAGQYDATTVRVVMDIKSYQRYNIFSLMNPFRIVVDVWGEGRDAPAANTRTTAKLPSGGKIPSDSLTRSLALGVSRIVVDAGHGGKDPGAAGYYRGAREKDITLSLAKRLKKKLEARIGCEVILTRDRDVFLTLEERTALANTKNADLFVSIHVNANRDHRAFGTETYILNLATDEESIRVAAMENATSTKNISDLQTILTELMQNAKVNESSRLASHVQSNLVAHLGKKYSQINDKGVKGAPFYVLLGSTMPAILVETAFISNPRECKRLLDPAFQDRLCDGLAQGIEKYIDEMNPTARARHGRTGGSDG